MTSITRFIDLKITNSEIMKPFDEKSAAVAKVHVVAREESAKAIANFTTELSAAILRLSVRRLPLLDMQHKIQVAESAVEDFTDERTKSFEAIKQFHLEGKDDE